MKAPLRAKDLLAFSFVGLTGALLVCAQSSRAQAPAGPVAAPPPGTAPAAKAPEPTPLPSPRQSILGAWKLNRDESDDPHQRVQDSRDSNSGGYGGRRGGGGWPGSGGGRRGGYGGGESDEDRQKMHELLSPPATMTFSMTGAEVDLQDDHDRKRAFMTDGRKLKKSKEDNYQEIAAKWDGNRLVTDEKSPRGGKMSRSFELSPDGRQLYENLHIESSGRNNHTLDMHYVYDISAQTAQ
ncbi:MAG TPA: hypothetical protein VJN92_16530 [Candidatus Acidoferrum sp.]|nr:hypothetical protein [Candidatus Acidoferrum sp.]